MIVGVGGPPLTRVGAAVHGHGSASYRAVLEPDQQQPATPGHAKPGASTGNSLDWAGYAVTGPTFSTVSGSWTQPAASCPSNKAEEAAFWVGIDGFSDTDPTVEQVGTDSDCVKGKGKKAGGPSYYAWYELYPNSFVELSTTEYPVSPGQLLTSSVTASGLNYTLAIADGTRWHFSTTRTVASALQNSSAEWIVESPSACTTSKCKILPLANFGQLSFTDASANGLPISSTSLSDHPIAMTTKNGKTVRASATSLGTGGNSFSVDWASN
jgi:hypothetical protein